MVMPKNNINLGSKRHEAFDDAEDVDAVDPDELMAELDSVMD